MPGIMLFIVRVLAKKTGMPLIRSEAKRRIFLFKLPCKSSFTAARQTHH